MYGPFGIRPDRVLGVDEIAEGDVDLLFCANTKAIRPRSATQTIEIFHGLSFRNMSVREENSGKDAYFLLGPYMRRAFAERGLLPEGDERAVEVGFMKTDRLLDGSLDRDALLAAARAREGSALDLDTWGRRGGALVTGPADVVAIVGDELAHPERRAEVRQAIARDLFYNPGLATAAAVVWLREELDLA